MSSVFHKHERSSSLVLGMKLHILPALETILLLCVVPTTSDTCRTKLSAWSTHNLKSNYFSGILFRQDYICTRLNFTATADWLKPNVKSYCRWTTQNHTAREQTRPAASLCTHLISLSVLSRRLQFPKGSCIPACNSLICLLMRHSKPRPPLPSQQSEATTCILRSDQTISSTNLIQTSFIFHKLLCCKIQINSSYNYSEVSPWHFYLSKRFFFYLAHSKNKRVLHHGVEKKVYDDKELRQWSLFHAHWICRFLCRRKST